MSLKRYFDCLELVSRGVSLPSDFFYVCSVKHQLFRLRLCCVLKKDKILKMCSLVSHCEETLGQYVHKAHISLDWKWRGAVCQGGVHVARHQFRYEEKVFFTKNPVRSTVRPRNTSAVTDRWGQVDSPVRCVTEKHTPVFKIIISKEDCKNWISNSRKN